MTEYACSGSELDLFQHAVRWKRYFANEIAAYISGDVLEVGGGIGATSPFLCTAGHGSWTSVEPDAQLAHRMSADLTARPLPVPTTIVEGTVRSLPAAPRFDTVIYIDVLEHIADDRAELADSAARLRDGGHLVVLAPALPSLFSPFDRAVGHLRRYTRRSLEEAGPASLTLVRAFYLDSLGMLANFTNRALLRSASPTEAQIRFWDSRLVPMSRLVDRITGRRFGKTVVAVWTKG